MATVEKLEMNLKVRLLGRQFFARPCDDGRKPKWAWCVEGVDINPDMTVKWSSTLYEPVFIRIAKGDTSIAFTHMTKAQAKCEAVLWQRDYEASGKGIPKKRGWRGGK